MPNRARSATVQVTVNRSQLRFSFFSVFGPGHSYRAKKSDPVAYLSLKSATYKKKIMAKSHVSGRKVRPGHSFRPERCDFNLEVSPLLSTNFERPPCLFMENFGDPLTCFWRNLVTPSPHLTQKVQYVT